jgi:hypothetical protein
MNEEQSLHEQIAAVSRSLGQQVSDQAPEYEDSPMKKRAPSDDGNAKTEEIEPVDGEGNVSKKMKRDSSVGYGFGNPTAEDMASLEALAQGSVPDMSTVASSIPLSLHSLLLLVGPSWFPLDSAILLLVRWLNSNSSTSSFSCSTRLGTCKTCTERCSLSGTMEPVRSG